MKTYSPKESWACWESARWSFYECIAERKTQQVILETAHGGTSESCYQATWSGVCQSGNAVHKEHGGKPS